MFDFILFLLFLPIRLLHATCVAVATIAAVVAVVTVGAIFVIAPIYAIFLLVAW